MEGLVSMAGVDARLWQGRSVFLTGHTGFKGSWLSMWLTEMGAQVHGFALAPSTTPNLFEAAGVAGRLASHTIADVRDSAALQRAMQAAQPSIVFHFAAQPLVRASYRDPADTWSTNVMGTVNLLDAVRACASVQAVVVVTTDKCYENREWLWGYRETDPLGGHDPYSASKGAAELVAASYRSSFFHDGKVLLATARAGNVIGGGDWSEDRLIPDAVRAVGSAGTLAVRNPAATRPWQHVLESLNGYLMLGQRLVGGDGSCATAFNFGPDAADNRTVGEVLGGLQAAWPALQWHVVPQEHAPHEAGYLYLDSSKAQRNLGWRPRWRLDQALVETANWYCAVLAAPDTAASMCSQQISSFLAKQ